MQKFLLFTAILFICSKSYSQDQHLLDSLLHVLNNSHEDSSKVKLLLTICSEKWKYAEYADAKKYADEALTLAERIDFINGIAAANSQIGVVYWYLNQNENALSYHEKALNIYKQMGNKKGISEVKNRIGHDYADMKNFPMALKNFQDALQLDEELNNQLGISKNLDLIGYVYMNLQDYPQALNYYFRAKTIAEAIGNKRTIGAVCHDIGVVYEKQNNFSEALKYATKGLSYAREVGEKHLLDEAYSGLEKIYLRMGNYQQAYEARLNYDSLEYVLRGADNAGTIKRMQMQYDFEKKEAAAKAEQEKREALAQKELLQQKSILNVFIGGFAIVLLFAGVFFFQRNRIRAGKKRSDELLLNILPEETAEELKSTGVAEARSYDEVTVMFTDFKNFTQASEAMNANELVTEINYLFSEYDKIISKYNIEKIKTIGDSYMCASGLPVENKTNAIDIVMAALDIRDFMTQLKEKRENKHSFEIRIGIHTGPVVAGIVGIKKFAYDIWGDTVNIASRMETSGETGKINISGKTYLYVKDRFLCHYRGKVHAKHKGEVDMYFVERLV